MDGIVNVYKEKGYTSHDVVAKLRGICHQKKIGHTGTLDPDAEGVLPVCIGTATKVCELLTDKDKEYATVVLLGKSTDTQDISGELLSERPVSCSEAQVRDCIQAFLGGYAQVPPMYSARRIGGKRLYELARAGIEVERIPRMVQLYDIRVEWINLPRVKLMVRCSKGTYIRTLCHDIGEKLGCGGCMEELLRTRSGSFGIADAYTLEQLEQLAKEGELEHVLLPVDRLFLQYPAVTVADSYRKLLENGNRLPQGAFLNLEVPSQQLRVYHDAGAEDFFGIYEKDEQRGDYRPLKIFWKRNGQ